MNGTNSFFVIDWVPQLLNTNGLEQWLRIKNALAKLSRADKTASGGPTTLLFITSDNPISASQIFPYYYFQTALRKQLNVVFSEIKLNKVLSADSLYRSQADFIFFQPWFDTSANDLRRMFETARSACPAAKFIFLDSYAPVDLRLADSVDEFIAVYIKKHVFRDRSRYGAETLGDTNLVDYYGKLYGLAYQPTTFKIPPGFVDKVVVGPSFLTSKVMLPLFANERGIEPRARDIDVHARLGGQGEDWYGRMRAHAIALISAIPSVKVVTGTGKSPAEYLRELSTSKLCFSPFGFGEVCWRDYEAVMCGALLIKPDMAHVETAPDIFVPYQTYVPVRWDFSDLEEKVTYYLNHGDERARIANNAYRLLSDYAISSNFVDHVSLVLNMARKSAGPSISVPESS